MCKLLIFKIDKILKDIDNEMIISKIVEGIQERKGKEIVVIDMSKLKEAPCSYFVICEGDSSTHVNAVATSIKDYVNKQIQIKPFAIDGEENAEWIAMDYGHLIVHVFQRPIRQFYNIEHLWADAELKRIDNLN